jgi:predicted permease
LPSDGLEGLIQNSTEPLYANQNLESIARLPTTKVIPCPGFSFDTLKLKEIWRFSKTPYEEVAFRSNKEASGGVSSLGASDVNLNRRFKMILRSAKISKTAFAVFGSIGAGIPFLDYVAYPGPESLVSAISLSLAISLAYVVFYSLQVLPEFSNSEAFSVLYGLPISRRDFSLIAVFSFIRTFDYLVIGTSVLQVVAVFVLTHSVVATMLMIFGALVNAIFASAIALWFAGLFYRKISHSAGRSRTATIGRLLFLIVWGFAAMSIGFLFNLLSYLLPFINDLIAQGYTNPGGFALSLIHPFVISIAIATSIDPSLLLGASNSSSQSILPVLYFLTPFLGTVTYAWLAFFVGKRTFKTVSAIAHPKSNSGWSRIVSSDYRIKVRSPLVSQILKDLRLASKNPSMAFLYALPVFVVFMLAIITTQFPVMHATAIIVSTVVGASFTIMICTTLLNTEGAALEYSFSLPVRLRQIVDAKALVSTLMFVPVPVALIILGLTKQLTTPYSLLIPVVELVAIYAACMSEITLFFGSGRSRGFSAVAGAGIGRLILSLASALVVFTLPLGAYAIQFTVTSNHVLSIFSMIAFSWIELAVVLGLNRHVMR